MELNGVGDSSFVGRSAWNDVCSEPSSSVESELIHARPPAAAHAFATESRPTPSLKADAHCALNPGSKMRRHCGAGAQSGAIRRNQAQSGAIRRNQMQSDAIRPDHCLSAHLRRRQRCDPSSILIADRNVKELVARYGALGKEAEAAGAHRSLPVRQRLG